VVGKIFFEGYIDLIVSCGGQTASIKYSDFVWTLDFFMSEWISFVNISFNIFFLETITTKKPIFCRNVPWVGLFKFCSQDSFIPNIYRTGSGKPLRKAKSLKNLLHKHKCQRWTEIVVTQVIWYDLLKLFKF
jgi:hypothetical protein